MKRGQVPSGFVRDCSAVMADAGRKEGRLCGVWRAGRVEVVLDDELEGLAQRFRNV